MRVKCTNTMANKPLQVNVYDELPNEVKFRNEKPIALFKAMCCYPNTDLTIINGKDGGRFDADGNLVDNARVRFATYYDKSGNKQSMRVSSALWVKDKEGKDVMSDEDLRKCITSLRVVDVLDRIAYEEDGVEQYNPMIITGSNNSNSIAI